MRCSLESCCGMYVTCRGGSGALGVIQLKLGLSPAVGPVFQ